MPRSKKVLNKKENKQPLLMGDEGMSEGHKSQWKELTTAKTETF